MVVISHFDDSSAMEMERERENKKNKKVSTQADEIMWIISM